MMQPIRYVPGVIALLCLGLSAFLRAAEPIALAPEEGILILQNGEVIAGKITQSGNRYYVALPNGELRLRAEDVALRCKDLAEGYAKKRAALNGTRVDEHLELAQWCLSQGLLDETETEIRYAATIDRGHPRLRLLARKLELARTKPEVRAPIATTPPPASDAEALEALTKSVPAPIMQRFATTVQPLLTNSCATAGCHGVSGKSTFTLTKIRGQGDRARRQTLRNLMAVLEQIDRQRPQESPLLTKPIEPHGGGKAAIFTAKNSRQYYELYEWVRLVTGERAPTYATVSPAAAGSREADVATDVDVEQAAFEADVEEGSGGESEENPYDPEAFNRGDETQ